MIENLGDHYMDLNPETSASQIDPDVLSLAEEKLCETIAPFEIELIGLKTVKPEFSDSLDELVDMTQQLTR